MGYHDRAKGKFIMSSVAGVNVGLADNGVTLAMRCPGANDVQLALFADDSFAGTVRIQGSLGMNDTNQPDTAYSETVDFSAASTQDNFWVYLPSFNMSEVPEAANVHAGADGYVFTGAEDGAMAVYVVAGGVEYVSVEVSGYGAGTLYVTGYAFMN